MGVQALHAGAGAAHAAVRPRAGVIGAATRRRARPHIGRARRRSSTGSISASARRTAPVASSRLTASTSRLADQPVARRHRFAVVEQGSVADDDRAAIGVADDDFESAARRLVPISSRTAATSSRTCQLRRESTRR